MLLLSLITGDVVAQAYSGQGNEAVVESVQVVPTCLQYRENGRRDEKEEDDEDAEQDAEVHETDVQNLVEVTKAFRQGMQQPAREDHQPLHQSREHYQRQRDADACIDDAEDLATLREWCHVAITWGSHHQK